MQTKATAIERKPNPNTGEGLLSLAQVDAPVSDSIYQERASRSLLSERKFTVPMAAKMLGIGESKMREIIRKGKIPVVLIDGKHLLVEADLETFLQRHYGPVRETEVKRSGLQPLPDHIMESDLLNEAG